VSSNPFDNIDYAAARVPQTNPYANNSGPGYQAPSGSLSDAQMRANMAGGYGYGNGLAGLGQQLQQAAQTDPAGTHALIQQHLATWGNGSAGGYTPPSGNAYGGYAPTTSAWGGNSGPGAEAPYGTTSAFGSGTGSGSAAQGGSPSGATTAPNTLGFPTDAASVYYNDNPSQGWQTYVNMLGGENTSLGRYASRHYGEGYAQFMQAAAKNPSLKYTDWLNQYASTPQMQQQYAQASPFARDPYNQPQWSGTRYLG
jgi:hypothetical protein